MSINTNEMDTWFRNAGLIDEGGERIEHTSRTEKDLKKLRERARKESEKFVPMAATMLETRAANEWLTDKLIQRPPSKLFGDLWREGEVVVLFGETGVGKSVLAVQIAENIARGNKNSPPGLRRGADASSAGWSAAEAAGQTKPQKVLLLDFELTKQQFTERYSAPSPIPGKLPVIQTFKFQRTAIGWDGYLPPAFKDVHEFMLHSISQEVERLGSRVVIIDNISYLAKNVSSHTSCLRIMKTLRHWAASEGLSILLIAQAKHRRRSDLGRVVGGHGGRNPARPIELDDLAGSRHIADLADSVFAIGRSTFGPEYRYVQHLKSRSRPLHEGDAVHTFQLGRSSGPLPAGGRVAAASDDGVVGGHPQSAFLSLTYLGPSAESDHLRDYAAEAQLAEQREKQQLSKSTSVVNTLMSREYKLYIEG